MVYITDWLVAYMSSSFSCLNLEHTTILSFAVSPLALPPRTCGCIYDTTRKIIFIYFFLINYIHIQTLDLYFERETRTQARHKTSKTSALPFPAGWFRNLVYALKEKAFFFKTIVTLTFKFQPSKTCNLNK